VAYKITEGELRRFICNLNTSSPYNFNEMIKLIYYIYIKSIKVGDEFKELENYSFFSDYPPIEKILLKIYINALFYKNSPCHFNLDEEIPEKEDLIKIYNIMKLLE
jgi:hypothetical protein